METIVGIDLGTTNCSITSIDENGKTHFIKNKYNEFITPSAVYFEKEKGKYLVGKEAKEKSSTDPENLVLFVKREMGKAKEKVRFDKNEEKYLPYKFWGKVFSPEEISAMILSQLKEDAENELGQKIKKAVITCPAYFGDAEKNATRKAGELAGFEVLEILPEPTAAALSYSAKSEKEEALLVFDLGGGTFDVTILKTKNSESGRKVEMVVTDGNHKLGGKDWDDLIIDYVATQFGKKYNIDLYYEKGAEKEIAFGKLRLEVEKAKVELFKNGNNSVQIPVEYGGKKMLVPVSREKYAQKTEILTNQCKSYCDMILKEGNLGWNDIDTILMIGNMSNCTTIQDALKTWSGKEINFGLIDPKICVSEGAAISGYLLEGGSFVKKLVETDKEISSFEQDEKVAERVEKQEEEGERTEAKFDNEKVSGGVISKAIGIKVLNKAGDEVFYQFFKKNSKYPESFSHSFPMAKSGEEEFTLTILEGESENLDDCETLGRLVVELGGKMQKKDKLKITLSLDDDGILQASAENGALGIKAESKIERESDNSDGEEEFLLG